jgi:hypothetical protein
MPGNQPNRMPRTVIVVEPNPVQHGRVWSHDWPHGGIGERGEGSERAPGRRAVVVVVEVGVESALSTWRREGVRFSV